MAAVLITAGAAAARPQPARQPSGAVAAPARSGFAGSVVFVGDGANIYLCVGACDKPQCLTCGAKAEQAMAPAGLTPVISGGAIAAAGLKPQYDLPTFSPDASQIAYSSRLGGSNFGVSVFDLGRHSSTTIFQSSDRPIYFSWLPDGRRLFFLASDGESLKLMLAQAGEAKPVRVLLTGLPLFFDWNQSLSELALHYMPPEDAGGPEQAALMKVDDRGQNLVKVIAKGGARFRTPAWSPDKKHLAWVVDNNNGQFALMVGDADGNSARPMVGLAPGTTAFVWAPDSRHIAFSTLREEGKMSYDGINLLDLASGNISALVSDPVVAYNFSPDGRWLAYIGITETSNSWNVIAAGGGKPRKLCDFVASGAESAAYQVFDQYALSHRIWSPDSKALVFAGVRLKQGQPPGENMPPASVWAVPIDGGAPREVGDGIVAFWSPR